jgi:hypothetical protein
MNADTGKLMIRTGGGYISLNEFIEDHNPWEESRKLMA